MTSLEESEDKTMADADASTQQSPDKSEHAPIVHAIDTRYSYLKSNPSLFVCVDFNDV